MAVFDVKKPVFHKTGAFIFVVVLDFYGQKSPPLYFFCTMRIATVPIIIPTISMAVAMTAMPSVSPKSPTIPLIKKLAVKVSIALPKALA